MTTDEKKLLQAKHRLEEVQMRDHQKERKARTRRLIQEGAILEKALPQTTQMTLEQLEGFCAKYSNQYDDFKRSGEPGCFSFFRKGALPHHLQSRRWYPARWSGSCALHEVSFSRFSRGAGNAASGYRLCSRLYILHYQQNSCFQNGNNPPSACENLSPTALSQL